MYPFFALIFIAIPWLNPFNSGPTPAVLPWLVSATCAVLLWLMRSKLSSESVSTGLLVAALASAFIGILQFFGQTDAFGMLVNSARMGEAYGNLRQRNQFATLMSVGLIALLWWVGQRPLDADRSAGNSMPSAGQWRLWLPAALLLATGNAVSGSRTGLLQWCLVLALSAMWWRRLPWRTLAVGAVAVMFYFMAIQVMPWLLEETTGFRAAGLLGRFNDDAGCGSRRVLWSNVLHLIAQKPWWGWGWGELDYAHFTTLYPGERFCDILDNAHNLPLHLAVELGLPLATTVCGAGLWLVLRAKPWREADPTRQMAWSVLAVIGLHSLLEYPLWYGPFQIAAGLSVWMLCCTTGAGNSIQESEAFWPPGPVWNAWAATVLIAIFAFAAWDYWRVSQLYLLPAERSSIYRDNTLDKVRGSWLFRNQVQFAELTTTPVTAENAAQLCDQALQLLHFSPEPRVVEKLIESAVLLGRDDEAAYYLARYRAAFPEAHARYLK
jgi:O-antigen ligase